MLQRRVSNASALPVLCGADIVLSRPSILRACDWSAQLARDTSALATTPFARAVFVRLCLVWPLIRLASGRGGSL
jgi:hypothetical protein